MRSGLVATLIAALLGSSLSLLRSSARAMQNAGTRRDPEIVHKARVSIRRMRAALRVFERKTAVRRAQKALKRLGQALGEARDWDVVQTRLLPERRAEFAHTVGKDAMRRVARRAQLARARANTAARRFVAGERFESWLVRVEELKLALERAPATSNTPADVTVDKATANRALARQGARVLRLGVRLAQLDGARRHRLRIETKRLRYAVELCAPVIPRHGRKQWLRTLKGLQEVLGTINDTRVLEDRLGPLGDDAALGRRLAAIRRNTVREQLPQAAALFMAWRLAPWKA